MRTTRERRSTAKRPAASLVVPLLVLVTLWPLDSGAVADPWQVHRAPGPARHDPLSELLAAAEDPGRVVRLHGRLTRAEVDRLLRALNERAAAGPRRSYPALLALGQLLTIRGRSGEALPALQQAAALRPERLAPAIAMAHALAQAGRRADAARLLETAAARPGNSGPGQAMLLAEAAELGEPTGDTAATDRRLDQALIALEGRKGVPLASLRQTLPPLLRLCRVALRRGQGAQCTDRLAGLPARSEADRRHLLQAEAELREALGDHPRALAAWLQIVRRGGSAGDRTDGPAGRALVLMDRLGQQAQIEALVVSLGRGGARNQSALLAAVERALQRGDKELGGRLFDHLRRALGRSPAALARLADLASRFNDPARVEASWRALLALDPHDERAIVALGEAHFQGGRRELARETWRRLERVVKPPASAHARLAELFGDHDMLPEAVSEARKAQRLERDNLSHHRTLARILERKRDNPGAISEWRAVLGTGADSTATGGRDRRQDSPGEDAGLRKEARMRLVALLAREGRERLRAETVQLKDRARRHPEERETALYLAELQLRLGQPGDAVETLTATASARPRDAEIVLLLVQLLRQSKQTIRALERLERFVADLPDRAPETWLRIASLRAERYEDRAALAAVGQAVALGRDDAEILTRGAELVESLGQREVALRHFRAALALRPSARAMAGVVRLRSLRGETGAATRQLIGGAPPAEATDRLLALATYGGTPSDLLSGPAAVSERATIEAVLTEVRGLYLRAPAEPAAARALAALGPTLAPRLYDLLFDPAGDPQSALAAVETLGMLGNAGAVPSLLRLAEGGTGAAAPGERLRLLAVVALGRLGDERAAAPLSALVRTAGPELRQAVVWALGRMATSPEAGEALLGATRDPRTGVAALAVMGLGSQRRLPLDLTMELLRDGRAPPLLRRAAAVAAARAALEGPELQLAALLEAPEPGLAACAAAALQAMGTPRSPELWRRALLGDASTRRYAARALAPLVPEANRLAGVASDEARRVEGGAPQAEALLDELCAGDPVPAPQPEGDDVKLVATVLAAALAEGDAAAEAALRALEGLATMPGETAGGKGPASQLMAGVRGPLRARLGDDELRIKLGAIRVAALLDPEALGMPHLASAVAAAAPGPDGQAVSLDAEGTAVLTAKALRVRGHLHPDLLRATMVPLLVHPAWQARRAAVRVLSVGGALSTELALRVRSDGSPLVRQAAQAD